MREEATPHRLIKSYVRREGRMTPGQKQGLEQYWSHFGLTSAQSFVDFKQVFANDNPVILEIGFGMGQSLLTMAQQDPKSNFVGIEVHRPGVGKLLSQLDEQHIVNVRIYQEDAVQVLKQSIPDASLQKVFIYFPDPWPKKRHHKRRLVQVSLLALLHQKLMIDGEVYLATDWEEYAHQMVKVFNQVPGWINQSKHNLFIERPLWRPMTKFEVRSERLGHGVWDLGFVKK